MADLLRQAIVDVWRTYHVARPTGNQETFTSEIGWPLDVVGVLWFRYGDILSQSGISIEDILWYLSYIALYDPERATAGHWDTYKSTLSDRIFSTRDLLRQHLNEVR